MKLKCEDHEARVMVLPSGTAVHRSDGHVCGSKYLTLGEYLLSPTDVLQSPKPTRTPEQSLLENLFMRS